MARSTRIARNVLALVVLIMTSLLFDVTLSGAQSAVVPGERAVVFGVGNVGLSVREGPGFRFPVLANMPQALEVDILEGPTWSGSVPWFLVSGFGGGGRQGWAAGSYLQPREVNPEPSGEGVADERNASARGGTREGKSFLCLVTGYAIQGRTATGAITEWGIVAVDPSVIPLGSKVLIDGFEQPFLAADTGGGVKGAFVDIWFPSYAEARTFGMQSRRVTVVDSSN
jgi:3D (Asp-Asp-Asp) domain-containing protein